MAPLAVAAGCKRHRLDAEASPWGLSERWLAVEWRCAKVLAHRCWGRGVTKRRKRIRRRLKLRAHQRRTRRALRPYGRYVPNAPHTIPACSCPSFSLWRSGFLLTLCHLNNGTFRDWGPLALLDSPILDLRLLPLFTHGVS